MSIMSAAGGAYTHMFTSLLRGGGIGKVPNSNYYSKVRNSSV